VEHKRVTLIVSDLHMGDGKPGDDFVFDKGQFVKFLRAQAATPEGRKGEIELIINGDFLECVQVNPQAYASKNNDYWCSETESLAKLACILCGHVDVFAALQEFQRGEGGANRVTLFAGNHDVDLYWDGVQAALRRKAGDVDIKLKDIWYQRYGGRLWISHGHLFPSIDPANGFRHWDEPRLPLPDDHEPKRLEMCPGTLFVVKYVNLFESKYPFADNLHPEIALAGILLREDVWGLKTVGWMLTRFAARYPKEMLSSDERVPDIGAQVRDAIRIDRRVREEVAKLYRDLLHRADMSADDVRDALKTDYALAEFIEQMMGCGAPWETWLTVLNQTRPSTLSSARGSSGGTLAIRRAGSIDVRRECIEQARRTWKAGAQIVVLGHTHLPQAVEEAAGRYYNPGSWTRYIEVEKVDSLTLEKLRNENDYPYSLNCVRIEDTGADALDGKFLSIDPETGAAQPIAASAV
jgi:UDP-2,3-diacylglucosamine pyrophosphatase LpxH